MFQPSWTNSIRHYPFLLLVVIVGCENRSRTISPITEPTISVVVEPTTIQSESQINSARNTPMKMSSRMSSRVKRDVMLQPPETMVNVVVRTGEATNFSDLEKFVREHGGEIVNAHQRAAVSIRLPIEAISNLADEPGVQYIDTGGKFAP